MARRKNVKRIDPRYFLNETVNRNDDGSRLEEGFMDTDIGRGLKAAFSKKPKPYKLMSRLRSLGNSLSQNPDSTGSIKSLLRALKDKKMKDSGGVRVQQKKLERDPEALTKRAALRLSANPFWKSIFKADPERKESILEAFMDWAAKWDETGHDANDQMPYLTQMLAKEWVPKLEATLAERGEAVAAGREAQAKKDAASAASMKAAIKNRLG